VTFNKRNTYKIVRYFSSSQRNIPTYFAIDHPNMNQDFISIVLYYVDAIVIYIFALCDMLYGTYTTTTTIILSKDISQ